MDFLNVDDETFAMLLSLETFLSPRDYRQVVAIPRYLRKRELRSYKKRVIHLSRVDAANKKARVGGKFAKN